MKKVLKIIICFLIIYSFNVNAASFNMNLLTNKKTVEVGEEVSISISLNNINGIPNGLNVCQASLSSSNLTIKNVIGNGWNITNGNVLIMDSANSVTSNTTIATITAIVNNVGNIKLSNIMCSDGENEYNAKTSSINFSIKEKTTTTTTTKTTTTKTTTTTKVREEAPITNNSTTTTTTTTQVALNNTFLTKLEIENYEINFDKNILEYRINVNNDVENIKFNYELEDKTSKVEIKKDEKLKIGENKIEIIVTNEKAETSIYVINVFKEDKKQELTFNEENILKSIKENNKIIDIKVDNKDNKIISTKIMKELMDSKKTLNLTVYDNNKKIYSFIIDGSKINDIKEVDFNLNSNSDYKSKIYSLIDNKENIIISFKSNGTLPAGTKIVLHNTKLNNKAYLYYYNQNKNSLEYITDYKIENNELSLNLENAANYVILNSKLNTNYSVLFIIASLIVIIIVLITLIFYFQNKKIQNLSNKKPL